MNKLDDAYNEATKIKPIYPNPANPEQQFSNAEHAIKMQINSARRIATAPKEIIDNLESQANAALEAYKENQSQENLKILENFASDWQKNVEPQLAALYKKMKK